MSSGSDSCQEEEVEKKDTSSNVQHSSKSRYSQARNIISTQPNVYTSLTLTSRSTESQQKSLTTAETNNKESVHLSAGNANKCNGGKLKGNNSSRRSAVKNQRSSVRPFFCCGSELSLVSLVEGMDLKDESHSQYSKKLQSIECYSSSDDESFELSPFRKRCNTVNTGETSRHSTIRRKKKDKHIKKKKFWSLRLHSRWSPRWRSRRSQRSKCSRDFSQQSISSGCSSSCNAVGTSALNGQLPSVRSISTPTSQSQFLGLFNFFHAEEIAEAARQRRTEEMALGIELRAQAISRAFRSNVDMSGSMMDILRFRSRLSSTNSDIIQSSDPPIEDLMNNLFSQVQNSRGSVDSWRGLGPQIHTQIDYVHYLVPDLAKITSCSYYWGVMDRYEAERLLENKPPGTFLLRDSAQEDFLFSVSFRRYNRSLHARIEQWNHRFSFDAHDPNVFSASTVCELVEHYKDPSLCMFFEPMLTQPLHRTFPFSLQHMSRTVICDRIAYDDIQALPIPNSFKKFLQTYHYKQKIRVRRFDNPDMASADSRVVP